MNRLVLVAAFLAATRVAAAELGPAPQRDLPADRAALKAAAGVALDRGAVVELYHTMFLPAEAVASGWAGSVGACSPGATSAAFKQAVLDRLNYYRRIAGLPGNVGLQTGAPVSETQSAALMFSANGALSHSPPAGWTCYTAAGADAAGNSNIALGASGVDAIDLYMDDGGAGNTAAGHRRWILYPPQVAVATGDIPASGGTPANALWTLGPFGTRPPTPTGVAWPPAGFVPWDVLPAGSKRWSFSYPGAGFGSALVTLADPAGVPIPVAKEAIANGYGDNTLVFVASGAGYGPPQGDATYRVSIAGVTGAPSSTYTYATTVIDAEQLPPALAADFNGDGKADVLWHNARTGETTMWLMNGTSFAGGATLLADPAWRVTHTGDFDGDGKADLVWLNTTTGATALWLMDGAALKSGVGLLSDGNWMVTHVADFDGDGRADLLWRNRATGETAMWLMNGTALKSGGTVIADPDWQVTHVGDFDGDGRADLVFRNATTGATALWLMNGVHATSGAGLLALPAWTVAHVADLDGDGRADIVWRNTVTGETVGWLMHGTTIALGATLHTSANWRVVQVGDFDGDGKRDLVWRNRSTGETSLWLMNGLAYKAATGLLADPDWQPARIGNFNGDAGAVRGRDDILWRNSRTGAHAIWLMSGTSLVSGAGLLTATAWWPGP